MAVPKNSLSTSAAGRALRTAHRRAVRPLVREAVLAARRARGNRWAHTPDFLIVGVQKGGTSGLFDALTASPAIGTPLVKEVHYFNRPLRPFEWYRNHFWGREPGLVWGESTPAYFDAEGVPARIVAALPDVRIVISLRDPLARAVSHYFHAVDFGLETRPLPDAFRDELAMLRSSAWSDQRDYLERGYLARSRYSTALRHWYELLPADRIRVVVAEERHRALVDAARFLLPGTDDSGWAVRNSNARPYEVPADLDPRPFQDFLRADAEELRSVAGWPELPPAWFRSPEKPIGV